MINEKEVIKTLQEQRSKNPVLDAVCTVFAARERARDRVTMQALTQRMKEDGFLYKEEEYEQVLRLLSKLGLGRLHVDSKGRVSALTDVKITLQSIGMAAVGQTDAMEQWHKRNKFQKIPIVQAAPARKEPSKVILEPAEWVGMQRERVQPRPAPGVWEVLCIPMKNGGNFKTYVPATLTKEDAELIGKALADMAKGGKS